MKRYPSRESCLEEAHSVLQSPRHRSEPRCPARGAIRRGIRHHLHLKEESFPCCHTRRFLFFHNPRERLSCHQCSTCLPLKSNPQSDMKSGRYFRPESVCFLKQQDGGNCSRSPHRRCCHKYKESCPCLRIRSSKCLPQRPHPDSHHKESSQLRLRRCIQQDLPGNSTHHFRRQSLA